MELNLNFVVFCLTIIALCSEVFTFRLNKGIKKRRDEIQDEISIDISTEKKNDGSPKPSPKK